MIDHASHSVTAPFYLWSGSRAALAGCRAELTPWLRRQRCFRPVFASASVWPGSIVVALSLLAIIVGLGTPPTPEDMPETRPTLPYFLGFFLIVGTLGAVNATQSWRGQQQLAIALTTGQILEGTVTHATGQTETVPGSREQGSDAPTSYYVVTLEYEFHAPTGVRLWASATAVRNDLEGGQTLPTMGHPVLVLYRDATRFVVL